MKLFLDTNVILDVLIPARERHNQAVKLLNLVIKGTFKAAVTTHSVIDADYVMTKMGKKKDFEEKLQVLMRYVELISVSEEDIAWACKGHINDFEDATHFSAALSNYCSVFITANPIFKTYSRMWTFTPGEFLDFVFGDYPNLLRD